MSLHSWGILYQELAEKIRGNIQEVEWIDLWHNQVGFLVDEHPFSTPAVFIAFRILGLDDLSEKTQQTTLQIDFYYFYETFLDTFNGAYNEADALAYLNTLTDLHKLFHGTSGDNYSEMRRTGLASVDTGSAGNLYKQTFTCTAVDLSALKTYENVTPGDVTIEKGKKENDTLKNTSFIIPNNS